MYFHVYACIWVVNDKITINTTAKLPQTAQQWTHHQQWHTGTLCSRNKKLLFISQPSCSPLAKSWPRSWCKTGGFLSLGSPDGRTRHADSTQPCGRAYSREWCRRPQLELGAISQGCERVARHTGQVQDSGDTQVWFQSEQCWATKIWLVTMGSNRRKSRSGRTGTPWDDSHRCALASWRWD